MFKRALSIVSVLILLAISSIPLNTQAQNQCRQIYCLDGTTGETVRVCVSFAPETHDKCECTEYCDPIIIED